MSGKGSKGGGNKSGGGGNAKSSSDGSGSGSGGSSSNDSREPTIVSGHEFHTYAQNSDRYTYIGKGDDGTPEFIDYGPKSGR